METLVQIAENLNELLEADQMDNALLEEICQALKEEICLKFKLMDFEFFNEERMVKITSEKKTFVRERNFEAAANQRDLEKNFEKHIRFKKYFNMEKSMFYPEDNMLVYFYSGTAKNDHVIYSRLTSSGTGFFKSPYSDQANNR